MTLDLPADLRDRVWFVIPAYNEARVIRDTIREVQRFGPNIVVVDDGSSDDTAQVARAEQALVARHPINLGQGAALATGLAVATRLGARYVVTFDADGQHDIEDVPPMLHRLIEAGADVALGSRFLGSAPDMPRARRLLLRAAVWYTRATSGIRLTDAHNGLRIFTRHAATRLRIRQNRMAHASELIGQIASLQLRYIEVPVNVRYTRYSLAKGQRALDSVTILKDIIAEKLAP